MHFSRSTLAALAALPLALAQTSTDCNPTLKTCPKDAALDSSTFTTDFTTGANTSWTAATGTTITYGSKGAEFTINEEGQAPTIQTDFYFFFGTAEVVMQAAPGTGIISSIVLESDDLDEIDWEFLGGNTTSAETNYFGKGNTTTYDRAIYYPVASPQTSFHTYTIDWTAEKIVFSIDGAIVRTLLYADCDGGNDFPQTPMRLKLGNWAGGAASEPEGTREWAGGLTDFSNAPFTMYVKSVSITNNNPGAYYEYSDETGDYTSIKVIDGSGSSSSASSSVSSASSSTTKASSTASSTTSSVVSSASVKASSVSVSVARLDGSSASTTKAVKTTAEAALATASSSSIAATTLSTSSSANSSYATATSTSKLAQQTTSGASANGLAMTFISIMALGAAFFAL